MELNKNIKDVSKDYNTCYKWYEFINNKGEKVVISIAKSGAMSELWLKKGFIKSKINNYICLETYVYTEFECIGKYNPTVNEHTTKLNFDYVLEFNDENIIYLLNKVYELANK